MFEKLFSKSSYAFCSSLFALFLFGIFLCFFIEQAFYYDEIGNIKTFSWTLNSDWMMHMAQVQAFSHMNFLDVVLHNPIYSGEILAYPFFVNWVSGLALSLTGNLVFSMLFPVYLGTFLFLFGIFFFVYQLTKNIHVAFLTPFIFFFLGGLHAYITLSEYNLFSDAWKNLQDYEYDIHFLGPVFSSMEYSFHWKSFFLTTFLPQRSFLWGMGIGSILLGFFVKNYNALSPQKIKNFYFFCIGLGIGCLSFVHTHTFFYFFFLFLLLFLCTARNKQIFLHYVFLAGGAILTSLPFLYLLSLKSGGVSDFSLFPFGDKVSLFEFWLVNWGLVFLFGLLILVPPLYKKITFSFQNIISPLLYPFLLSGFLLLCLFSVWQLQNNPWDNTKVYLWSGLLFSVSASLVIVYVWKQFGIFGKIVSSIFLLLSTISGTILFWSGVNDNHVQVFSVEEIENAQKIIDAVAHDEIILTSDYFHHFVSPLTPNQIFMGYRGWIGSYGMDWQSKVETAKIIYSGGKYKNLEYREVFEIMKNNNLRYVFVDNSASAVYEVDINYAFFNRYFDRVLEFENGGVLYKKIGE